MYEDEKMDLEDSFKIKDNILKILTCICYDSQAISWNMCLPLATYLYKNAGHGPKYTKKVATYLFKIHNIIMDTAKDKIAQLTDQKILNEVYTSLREIERQKKDISVEECTRLYNMLARTSIGKKNAVQILQKSWEAKVSYIDMEIKKMPSELYNQENNPKPFLSLADIEGCRSIPSAAITNLLRTIQNTIKKDLYPIRNYVELKAKLVLENARFIVKEENGANNLILENIDMCDLNAYTDFFNATCENKKEIKKIYATLLQLLENDKPTESLKHNIQLIYTDSPIKELYCNSKILNSRLEIAEKRIIPEAKLYLEYLWYLYSKTDSPNQKNFLKTYTSLIDSAIKEQAVTKIQHFIQKIKDIIGDPYSEFYNDIELYQRVLKIKNN